MLSVLLLINLLPSGITKTVVVFCNRLPSCLNFFPGLLIRLQIFNIYINKIIVLPARVIELG